MENDNGNGNGSNLLPIVLGFMAGAVSGAAVALLLAPASGRDTRAQIGGAYRKSTESVARIPAALGSASKAARTAFAEARAEDQDAHEVTAPTPANGG